MTKPFGIDELLARLRAALRRVVPSGEPVIEVGYLRIDLEKQSVHREGKLLSLTPNEFSLLRLFAQNHGKLLTHLAILRAVWGPSYQTESHYIHVYVSQLRRKIEATPHDRAICSPSPALVIASSIWPRSDDPEISLGARRKP